MAGLPPKELHGKTKIIPEKQAIGPAWDKSRDDEFGGIQKHDSFEVISPRKELRRLNKSSVSHLNIVPWLWVYTIKPDGRLKSRLCLVGTRDKGRARAAASSPSLSRQGWRACMQTAVQHRWFIHSGDVPQAFLKQDPAEWKREEAVYAYPPRGVKHGLGHDTILRPP